MSLRKFAPENAEIERSKIGNNPLAATVDVKAYMSGPARGKLHGYRHAAALLHPHARILNFELKGSPTTPGPGSRSSTSARTESPGLSIRSSAWLFTQR